MIGRPEVDPRTCEPTRGVVMLHILKHRGSGRQSQTAKPLRDPLARTDRDVLSALAQDAPLVDDRILVRISPPSPTHRRGEVMRTNPFDDRNGTSRADCLA
jgi:hypothetical protein